MDVDLRALSKLEKEDKINGGVISITYSIIVTFPIYNQSGAIWKLNSGCMIHVS